MLETERPDVPPEVDALGARVVDAIFAVHRGIGPGALESIYKRCLAVALRNRGLAFEREVWIDVTFEGEHIERVLRADFLIEGCIVLEAKATVETHPAHFAQVVTYLRARRLPLGYLVNFHMPTVRQAIHRIANTWHVP